MTICESASWFEIRSRSRIIEFLGACRKQELIVCNYNQLNESWQQSIKPDLPNSASPPPPNTLSHLVPTFSGTLYQAKFEVLSFGGKAVYTHPCVHSSTKISLISLWKLSMQHWHELRINTKRCKGALFWDNVNLELCNLRSQTHNSNTFLGSKNMQWILFSSQNDMHA